MPIVQATFTLLKFKCQIVISFFIDIIIKASKSIFLMILDIILSFDFKDGDYGRFRTFARKGNKK